MTYVVHTKNSRPFAFPTLYAALYHVRVLWPDVEVDEPIGTYRACWATRFDQRERNPLAVVAAIQEKP